MIETNLPRHNDWGTTFFGQEWTDIELTIEPACRLIKRRKPVWETIRASMNE